jgi:diphthamide synthase (EF-2-diphthine--ammonia ligase)
LQVVGLLTTVNRHFDRVAMHAVRTELLRAQAEAAQLPLLEVGLPWPCSNEEYEAEMTRAVAQLKADGVTVMAFGDLFLEDIRAYRCEKLAGTGIEPCFPLWGLPTSELARDMIRGGLKASLTCVDPRAMPAKFVGRAFDAELLQELPAEVDPCGERGEFHTFTHDWPMFKQPIVLRAGEIVERDGFVFADFMLDAAAAPLGTSR